ncbi:MAG: PEP-CTERM sorting domain-containing protein [Verrucomicrobiae bacterium]
MRNPSFLRRSAIALAALGLLTICAQAAVVFNLDFATDVYTGNFTAEVNPSKMSWAGGSLVYAPSGALTSIIDYTPGGNLTTTFQNETLSVTSSASTLGGSLGILTRLNGATLTSTGILGLVNILSTTSVRLRLFYGADNNAGAGTNFYDTTFSSLSNPVAVSTPLTLELAQSFNLTNSIFNVTLSDADGLVATSGNQTLTASHSYDAAGLIGLRFSAGTTTQWNTSNFSSVPEPSTWTLLALGLGAGVIFRRHRARSVDSCRMPRASRRPRFGKKGKVSPRACWHAGS